jgi:hypothetical protein
MKVGTIEKNVPFPEVHSKFRFPWAEMEVGDSVFIKAGKAETIEMLKRIVKGSSRYYGVKTGKKYRTLINRQERGVRVWRVD